MIKCDYLLILTSQQHIPEKADFLLCNNLELKTFGKVLFLVSKFFPDLIGRNCAFPQNFHTRKLGEITVFYAVGGALFNKS